MGCRVMQRPFIVSVGFVHKKRKARKRTSLRQRVLSARRQMSERI